MAGKIKTVDDLVSDVRSMTDEENREAIDTDTDILPALNRAQDYASNILARHYESPLLTNTLMTVDGGEFDVPADCFEQRIEKLEVKVGNLYYPMERVDYRDIGKYEDSNQSVPVPYFYCMVGDTVKIVSSSNGTYQLRVWYLKDPLPLVLSQGRITRVNTSDNYILVDEIGSDLTTEQDNLDSYVNIIDGQSGTVKVSLQIRSISDNRITFKTSPTRSTVLGHTIASAITSDVEADDYICVVKGSCIPLLKKPFSNFLIQYAVAELTRKLGGAADMEERVKQQLEQQVERSWVGREQYIRVAKRSAQWSFPFRRWFK